MRKLFRFSMGIALLATAVVLHSCQNNDLLPVPEEQTNEAALKSSTANTFYSKTVPVGHGVARAWIQVNKAGDPESIGINLSGKALMDLPDEFAMYMFEFPRNKGDNFYTHLTLDWNPEGHEPPHIYGLPHFDFHFYTIPYEERMMIPGMGFPYMDTPPAEKYRPPGYFQLPGLIPAMGAHWANGASPELQNPPLEVFTHTFIWGSYSGEYIFWEPMITLDYLLSKPDGIFPIPQPEAYARDGWYATHYKISYSTHPDEYTVALLNLTYHEGE